MNDQDGQTARGGQSRWSATELDGRLEDWILGKGGYCSQPVSLVIMVSEFPGNEE